MSTAPQRLSGKGWVHGTHPQREGRGSRGEGPGATEGARRATGVAPGGEIYEGARWALVRKLECFGGVTWATLKEILRGAYPRSGRSRKKIRQGNTPKRYSYDQNPTAPPVRYLPHLLYSPPTGPRGFWQLVEDENEIIGELSKEEEHLLEDLLKGRRDDIDH